MRACFPAPTIAWLKLDRTHSPSRGIECPFLQARRSPELAKPSAGTEPTALRRPLTCPPTRWALGRPPHRRTAQLRRSCCLRHGFFTAPQCRISNLADQEAFDWFAAPPLVRAFAWTGHPYDVHRKIYSWRIKTLNK